MVYYFLPSKVVACTVCPAGFYCSDPSAEPVPCASGNYATGGVTSCTPCPEGQYCIDPTGSPVNCEDGYYSAAVRLTTVILKSN